jgi:hypothetical protein
VGDIGGGGGGDGGRVTILSSDFITVRRSLKAD